MSLSWDFLISTALRGRSLHEIFVAYGLPFQRYLIMLLPAISKILSIYGIIIFKRR